MAPCAGTRFSIHRARLFHTWFAGAQTNTCYNAIDRHVDGGRADQAALIYDSPVTGTKRTFTYGELRDDIALLAGVLRSHGVGPGDRVIIYMPMVPRTVMAMLACARLGAVHSVVFGGFASSELATRIDDCTRQGHHVGIVRYRTRARRRL